jgi:sulfur carrier protein ThiS adenylyltransferase
MISIFVNEQKYEVSKGTTFHYIKNKVKDNADIIIINGYPVDNENDLCKEVNEGDHIILIKRERFLLCRIRITYDSKAYAGCV